MKIDVIRTGSKGNATIIDNKLLIDCGVPFKLLKDKKFNVVLLTHEHSDHFNKRTIKKLAEARPLLRWAAPVHLAGPLSCCGVPIKNIDVTKEGPAYSYKMNGSYYALRIFALAHDVPNVGWRIQKIGPDRKNKTLLYITDTGSVDDLDDAELFNGLDYYLIEANYDVDEINRIIEEKQANGVFCYETRVKQTHLSRQQAEAFIARVAGEHSKYMFMHQHEDRPAAEDPDGGQL